MSWSGPLRMAGKKKTSSADNHYLDCEVYAACAADQMGAFALLEEQPEAEEEEPTYQREQDEEENWFGNDDDYDWGGDWI